MKDQDCTVKLNETAEIEVNTADLDQLDIVNLSDGAYHILKNNKSYKIEVLDTNASSKSIQLKINGRPYNIAIEDHYDRLVKKLGLSAVSSNKVNQVKAPMPGLVLEVAVEIGQAIKKGDGLLILEAMKMENVIKSGGDGVVKEILIEKGTAVDKGQLLIQME